MFKHFVALVVRSGCSVFGVLDSGDKFFKGNGLIYSWVNWRRRRKVLTQKSCFNWQEHVNKTKWIICRTTGKSELLCEYVGYMLLIFSRNAVCKKCWNETRGAVSGKAFYYLPNFGQISGRC